MRQRNLSSNDP